MDGIAQRESSLSRAPTWWTEPVEAMPHHLYAVDGGSPETVADLYVRGPVSRVEPGRSFVWTFTEDEVEQRQELPFNDPDAQVSTILVTVAPEAVIESPNEDSPVNAASEVTFGVALDAPVDLEAARTEFSSGTIVAALLVADSPVFDQDPNLWSVLYDGAMLGLVEEDEVLFLALNSHTDDEGPYSTSVEELEDSTPAEPIHVRDGHIVGG